MNCQNIRKLIMTLFFPKTNLRDACMLLNVKDTGGHIEHHSFEQLHPVPDQLSE